jgi:hypothetical protein
MPSLPGERRTRPVVVAPADVLTEYLFTPGVTPWARGRPARVASPRARCPRSRRKANTSCRCCACRCADGVPVHTWGDTLGARASRPRLRGQDALAPRRKVNTSFASPRARCPRSRRKVNTSCRCCACRCADGVPVHTWGDTLGARASRPRRVSEGKMPSPQEKSSPRARCPRSRRKVNTSCRVSEGKMPSLRRNRLRGQDALAPRRKVNTSCRVSEGKMPSPQEKSSPRARCPR